ncbi:ABC transporter substrate-binding protein [Microlunatus soli]|uniref:Multiple sugar transport system substrate-binding protein n=1 Tax=Microlunatus soli TaxID=630515 RepID=A0A1H1Z2S9_9ACTN|nr:extracellular solute-binding protein [Microlunatus soli]SDT27909.1 multiple sugar transport system substrate-binding protein [Microlunatus soli]
MTGPTPHILGRRALLGGAAGLAAAGLVGCSDGGPTGPGTLPGGAGKNGGKGQNGGKGAITWWDHNVNLQKANGAAYDAFTKESGIGVDYTYVQTAKLGQTLQLAKQSKQLPNIHSTAGLELSIPALIADGWFQPIEWEQDVRDRFGDDGLVDGLHVFDDKIYSFPIFADKQYVAAQWYNKSFIDKAGIGQPPTDYDEFRDACRKVMAANEGSFGFIFALGHTGRLSEQVNAMAQAAGFEGLDGTLFRTGEVAYHDQAYLAVIEFLRSLQTDKLVFPGASSLDDQTARARWAAGAAGYYMDGPWCSGTVQTEMPQFLTSLDVGPMLVPDASHELVAYRGRQGGNYYVSSAAEQGDACSRLLSYLPGEKYNIAIADAMAQPPYDLTAIEKSKAIEPWRRLIASYQDCVFIAPQATLQNADVQQVARHSKDIKPGLGEIVQGVFSGDVTDVRGALKKLSDATAADREQAIAKAKAAGASVSADSYAFGSWKPRTDFTSSMYSR